MASGGKEYQLAVRIVGKLDSSFTSAVSRASSGMNGLGLAGKAIGASVKFTATALAATATAVAGVAAASVKTGAEFEAAMSSVAATAGATEEEYKALEAAALEMGRTTSKTASESAAALEYMALAGWSVDQSIKGLPSILRLSEATGLDLARTSDLVTDSMSALGVTVDGLAGYLDIAAKANNKSNQTAEQLMEAYLGVGGTMKNLNVPLEESATALGVLANRGIKGSEAGTALNAIMVNLTTGSGKAGTMMEKLGISAFDAEGNFIGLEETLQALNTALQGCTEEERNAALAAIGGKTHVDALNDLMSGLNTTTAEGVSEWAALESELSNANGALEEMAATKLDNLNGDMAIFKSALEDTGIAIYKNLQDPLRGAVQFGTQEIYKLSDALKNGGFTGMIDAMGGIITDCASQLAEGAPTFINTVADILEAVVDGIDQNSPQIGAALGRAGSALVTALIRLTPKMIVTGAHLMVEFAKGIRENFPEIKAAAQEAIQYLMEAAKDALKGYVDFLGDDEVAPFEKILALIPAVAAGFAGFKVISGAVSGVKGLISTFKGLGKAAPIAKNGLGGVGSSMSSMAKNILGVGVGLAAAAAGIWLLVDAAKAIANAGPGATTALILMVGGIAGLIALAATMGPKLQSSQQGLLAFGAAILMAAAGMAVLAFAAVQIAQAGPLAIGALALLEGGIIALMAVAGAMGTQLATAAPGLLAFGAAIILAGAGMAIMVNSAIQLAAAGGPAIAVFAGLAVAVAAFMVVAALLGPMLISGGAGMLLLGAGLLLAAAGMALLANTAIQLSAAGAPALITMAALAAGILVFGAAAGLLAPLLLAGAAALAAFGAALVVVSAGAILGGAALAIITACLPGLAANGATGAVAIMQLGVAMMTFGVGATVAGAGALVAGAGLLVLGAGALVAVPGSVALAAALLLVAAETSSIASDALTAADSLSQMVASVDLVKQGLSALGDFVEGAAKALAGLFQSTPDFSGPAQKISASVAVVATAAAALGVAMVGANTQIAMALATLTALGAAGTMSATSITRIATALRTIGSSASSGSTAMRTMASGMTQMGAAGMSSVPGMASFATAITSASAASTRMSAGVSIIVVAFTQIGTTVTATVAIFKNGMSAMVTAQAQVTTGMTAMRVTMMAVLMGLVNDITTQMNRAKAAVVAAVSAMRSTMNFTWSLPYLKMPHIKITGSFSVDPPKAPQFSVSWYKEGGILDGAQIFGAAGNTLLGGGEAGQEAVLPLDDLWTQMRSIMTEVISGTDMASFSALVDRLDAAMAGGQESTPTDLLTGLTGDPDDGGGEPGDGPLYTITFSPTYQFYGEAPTQEDMTEAARMSQDEFNDMMDAWVKDHSRKSF